MREQPAERIHKNGLKVWRITGVIVSVITVFIAIGFFVLSYFTAFPYWIAIVFLIAMLLLAWLDIVWIPNIRWERWRYEVTDDEIDLQHGIWWIQRTLIPMVRVQHVDTEQGPLLRKYDLATIKISTAAGVEEIPALLTADAEALRDQIAALAKVNENEY